MTQQEACSAYIKLIKQHEELTPTEISLARESFNEGWSQRELKAKQENS